MRIRIFNCGPVTAHEVRIVRVDASAKEIETEESGGLVSVWNHRMLVEALPGNRSRYTDCIDLRAGLLTLAVWLFASLFYRVRQRRWIRLLAELAKEESDE